MNQSYQVRINYGQAPVQEAPRQLQARVLAVLRCLEPKRVVGFHKTRLGRDRDGGYVHIDDFERVGGALSCGISDDVSWDIDIARRNVCVYQFDHTIAQSPAVHPLFRFHRTRVAAADGPGAWSLDTIATRCLGDCERAIVKMDIEGDEWGVLRAASAETLSRFSQIVCELHGFNFSDKVAWTDQAQAVLLRLKEQFEVVHVHGNNARPFVNVANVTLPMLLEVTFANRAHYQFTESNETFPTPLDRPNLPQGPDMRLGCFRF
jgi:hypothetical protein